MVNPGKYDLWNSLNPDVKTVLFQLERLRRHYENCVRTYDQIAMYELSHSLRIWTDLKTTLPKLAPAFHTCRAFKSVKPPKKLMHAMKAARFVMAYMPGGVVVYAHQGELLKSPPVEPNIDFTLGANFKNNPDGSITLSNYIFTLAT